MTGTFRRFAVALVATWASTLVLHAKTPIRTPGDVPVLGEVDAYLLKTLYRADDPNAGLASLLDDPEFQTLVRKHDLKLFGGPMLGCLTDRSARLWVRTTGAASVQWVVSKREDLADPVRSPEVQTGAEGDFTALLDVGGLEPFTLYHYDVLVDGASVLAGDRPTFRTYPSPGRDATFHVAFGGGAKYISEKERIWETVAQRKPAAFLFLGDNVYIDQPLQRNAQRVHYYRRQLRPEYRRLTSSTAIYAIWDDHDFGKNDCAGGLAPFLPAWKLPVWRVFRENWNNPAYGGGEKQPGCWFDFTIGDVQFFMLDNRYYRDFKKGSMLGPAQRKWLLDRLEASTATFKVLCNGTLWTEHADKGGRDSWWGVPKAREAIFSHIDKQKIGGVILLSADRHRTDVYKIDRPAGYPLYEFETSKLTNNHTHRTRDAALFSYNKGNFFGLLTFHLKGDDPTVTFQCITSENKSVYRLTLQRSQLEAN
jgi:alkaline phosphatase D